MTIDLSPPPAPGPTVLTLNEYRAPNQRAAAICRTDAMALRKSADLIQSAMDKYDAAAQRRVVVSEPSPELPPPDYSRDDDGTAAARDTSREMLAKRLPTLAKKLRAIVSAIEAAHGQPGNMRRLSGLDWALTALGEPDLTPGAGPIDDLAVATGMLRGTMYVAKCGDYCDLSDDESASAL